MNTQEMGDRIKTMYEDRTRVYLPRRTYTIIRIDGKNFSNYTRALQKPFDADLASDFNETTVALCSEIMGCRMAYTQSDEITLVLSDFESANSDAWFDGNVQKVASVSASMATMFFNRARQRRSASDKGAFFDSRVFTISDREDVIKCLLWRQADAVRNSVSMIGRAHMSHKEMDGVGIVKLRSLLKERGVDVSSYPTGFLQGRIIVKESYLIEEPVRTDSSQPRAMVSRTRWVVGDAPSLSEAHIPNEWIPYRTPYGRNSHEHISQQ